MFWCIIVNKEFLHYSSENIVTIFVKCFFRFSLKCLKKTFQRKVTKYTKSIILIPYWVGNSLLSKKICFLRLPSCFSLHFIKSLILNTEKMTIQKICFRFLHFGILSSLNSMYYKTFKLLRKIIFYRYQIILCNLRNH
uniref:Uncharacterized protein n=1 Tax=Lotharella vacuolata TaxID=74820 RepID=A0A0H5BJY5_9EUKA|nr:hypothetical protein [Lotharella vacuolata]